MDRPCVARGFQRWRGWSCANVIRPAWGASAPGRDGDPHASDLISGQALSGHLGHQITDAPARPFAISCSSRRPRRVSTNWSSLTCSSGELGAHPRLVAAAVVQHAPRNAGELVGQCRSDDVVMHALGGSLQPPAEAVLGPIGWPQQHDPSRLHEQHAKIAIPALGDAAEDGAIAGRDLSWYETEPGTEVAPALEG